MIYYLIVKLENTYVFKKNTSALCARFNLPIDAVGKQLKTKHRFKCPHSGTTVELINIPIQEYKTEKKYRKTNRLKKKPAL